MDKLKEIIEIVEKANGIRLAKEKVQPIYEQMVYCRKDGNEIVSKIGDVDKNLYVLLSGTIRLYYIDMDGNDISRFFGTKGFISGGSDASLPFGVETLEVSEFLIIDAEKIKGLVGEVFIG